MERTGQPGYKQIADDLRAKIRTGELSPGGKLSSIDTLAGEYGASVSVVKQALTVLKIEQLLIGQQGKGVFVSEAPVVPVGGPQPLDVQETLRELLGRVAELERQVEELSAEH